MPQSSHLLRMATLGVLTAALMLGACGRKGPLDPPPGTTPQPMASEVQPGSEDTSTQSVVQSGQVGPDGRPLAPRGPKKKLPADALID